MTNTKTKLDHDDPTCDDDSYAAEAVVDQIEEKLNELAKLYRTYCGIVPAMRARVEAYAIGQVDALRSSNKSQQCTVDELRDEAIRLGYPEPDEGEDECPCLRAPGEPDPDCPFCRGTGSIAE